MANLRLTPASGAPIEISKDGTVVGRDPSCDIVLADGSVSRKHARLERRGETWTVVDQGSANGTFVDSQRVAETALRAGHELRFGALAFRIDVEETTEATVIGLGADHATVMSEGLRAPAPPAVPRPTVPSPPPPPPPRATPPPPPPPSPQAARPPLPPSPAARPSAPARSGAPAGQMAPPPAPAKKQGPWMWIGIGCCGCLLLAGLGALAFFLIGGVGIAAATQPPVDAVNAQLSLLRSGNVDAAYVALSESYRSQTSPEAFAQLVAQHPGLRANQDFSVSGRAVENERASVTGELKSVEGSSEPAEFRLRKEEGAWRITNIEIAGLSE